MEAERPSIGMLLPDLAAASLKPMSRIMVDGYDLRSYRPGDEAAWSALMNTGSLGDWTVERTVKDLTGCAQFDPESLFLLMAADGSLAASACAWTKKPDERTTGTLHMVCVDPAHRGRRLSEVVCTAALHRFRQRGFARVDLSTEEWRPGAVKVYLQLGFRPVYSHHTHADQWAKLRERLHWPEPLTSINETE